MLITLKQDNVKTLCLSCFTKDQISKIQTEIEEIIKNK